MDYVCKINNNNELNYWIRNVTIYAFAKCVLVYIHTFSQVPPLIVVLVSGGPAAYH